MKRPVIPAFFALVVAVFSGMILFSTSQAVQEHEEKLQDLRRAIAVETERRDVLLSEWAYLTRPERLETLAASIPDIQIAEEANIYTDPSDFAKKQIETIETEVTTASVAHVKSSKSAMHDFQLLLQRVSLNGGDGR